LKIRVIVLGIVMVVHHSRPMMVVGSTFDHALFIGIE